MLEIATALFTGITKLFSIKFPGLNISFFGFFVAVAILHVVINTILTIYGVRSEPDDIVSAVAYDYTQDKLPGLAPRHNMIKNGEVNKLMIHHYGRKLKTGVDKFVTNERRSAMINKADSYARRKMNFYTKRANREYKKGLSRILGHNNVFGR